LGGPSPPSHSVAPPLTLPLNTPHEKLIVLFLFLFLIFFLEGLDLTKKETNIEGDHDRIQN
jgi:hypothetical protein